MLRAFVCAAALLAFGVSTLSAADEDKTKSQAGARKRPTKAKIVKVNPKKQTITVQMKDKTGKEVEKTFKLVEDIRMLDESGKIVAVDVFRNGDDVLVVEREGRLVEMRRNKGGKGLDQFRKEK
jgi:3-dehydroquinate synthase class II